MRYWLGLFLLLLGVSCRQQDKPRDSLKAISAVQVEALPYPEKGIYGGERVMGNTSLPNSFNPYLASDSASMAVIYQMFVGLTAYDALNHQIVPALAERWTSNADKTRWTFFLRKHLSWSDGHALTAQDVAFTYQKIINNPKIPNNYKDFWAYQGRFPNISVVDEQTIVFELDQPFAPFLYNLMAPIVPQHVFQAAVEAKKDTQPAFFKLWGLDVKPEALVTNGPWKLQAYVPGERVVLERNPHYYERDAQGQKLPYLERLILLDVQDSQAALLRFRRHELDTYLMNPSDYDLLGPEQEKGGFSIYNLGPSPSSLFITFNMSTARRVDGSPVVDPVKSRWFRDVHFRRAFSHLIDKAGLINSVYRGRAVSQYSHLNQHNPFFNSQLQDYEYNPAKARQILAQAGYTWDTSGSLHDSEGHRVRFELTTNVSNVERDAACALLRRSWAEIGVEVNYRPTHFSILVGRLHETYDWDVMLMGLASNSLEPHFSSSRWKLDGRMHIFNKGNGQNWQGQATSFFDWEREMESLYQAAALETDFKKRKTLYWRAQEIEREYLPFLYTVSEMDLIAVQNNLGNIRPSVYGGSGLHQINWNSARHYLKPDVH